MQNFIVRHENVFNRVAFEETGLEYLYTMWPSLEVQAMQIYLIALKLDSLVVLRKTIFETFSKQFLKLLP